MTVKDSKITEFKGEEKWLSNFVLCEVALDGVFYPTVENAYQAAKTVIPYQREFFTVCSSAEAKKRGKTVDIRPDWHIVREQIMENLLRQKFAQPKFAKKLIETGTMEIEEGNYWSDEFWGICLRTNRGQNKLGKIIMKIRSEITAEVPEELIVNPFSASFRDPREFLDKLSPFEDVIPQLAKMIVCGSNSRRPNKNAYLVNIDNMGLSDEVANAENRMEFRKALRADYQAKKPIQALLEHIADKLIDCEYSQIHFYQQSGRDPSENFQLQEIRRAVIGIVNKKLKPFL